MGKFLVRLIILFTGVYFIYACYYAQYFGIDILIDFHPILFELIVVVYAFSEGKYHCKYLKFLAVGILSSDILTRFDNYYDFLTVTQHNLIPIFIIASSMLVSLCMALHHFYKVRKLKRKRP